MVGEKKSVLRGCVKAKRGPWVVHKTAKDGTVSTTFRFPSDGERQKNKERERERRVLPRNIFKGLRAHGNYQLPKHADSNDLLKALCREAGWHVEEDGTVKGKVKFFNSTTLVISIFNVALSIPCKLLNFDA